MTRAINWQPAQEVMILQLAADGAGLDHIAKVLGRSRNAVERKMELMGLRAQGIAPDEVPRRAAMRRARNADAAFQAALGQAIAAGLENGTYGVVRDIGEPRVLRAIRGDAEVFSGCGSPAAWVVEG